MVDTIEEERRLNKIEMEKRVERVAVELRERYPMQLDNVCRSMSEDEFKAYIRKRRAEFEPIWEAHLEHARKQSRLVTGKEQGGPL
jgi:hypothetical protein